MKRTLTLKKEHLAELTSDELRAVNGAEIQATPLCLTKVSDLFISVCGCLTNYCSIDVC